MFNYTRPVKAGRINDPIMTVLNPNLSYQVSIHQPNFSIISFNPMAMPTITVDYIFEEFSGKQKIVTHYLKAYREEKIDRDGFSCNNDKEYSFKKCIRNTLSKEIWCKLPWDTDTTGLSRKGG